MCPSVQSQISNIPDAEADLGFIHETTERGCTIKFCEASPSTAEDQIRLYTLLYDSKERAFLETRSKHTHTPSHHTWHTHAHAHGFVLYTRCSRDAQRRRPRTSPKHTLLFFIPFLPCTVPFIDHTRTRSHAHTSHGTHGTHAHTHMALYTRFHHPGRSSCWRLLTFYSGHASGA